MLMVPNSYLYPLNQKKKKKDDPGIPWWSCSQDGTAEGLGSILGWGTKIPGSRAAQPKNGRK